MAELTALVCDVDDTLLGDDDGLREFAAWLAPRRAGIRLAYNSGRFVASIRESIRRHDMPEPDAIVGGVGAEIALADGSTLPGWPTAAASWNPATIDRIVTNAIGAEPQSAEFLAPFKRSFFLHDAEPAVLSALERALRAAEIAARVVYSSQRDLDVLPAGVDKGTAARRLVDHWRIPAERVVVAGDSGNDLAMFEHGFCGVVVANASRDLYERVSPNAYRATRRCAAGVREGFEYWWGRKERAPS